MAYTDIESLVTEFNTMTTDALEKANEIMATMGSIYLVGNIPPPTANAMLTDPTFKQINSLTMPSIDNGSSVALPNIYQVPNGQGFGKTLSVPPVYSGPSTMSFTETKGTWLIDEVRPVIFKLFNETGFEQVESEIWNKGVEKRVQKLRDDTDSFISGRSMKGFTMPNDMDNIGIEALERAYDDETLNLNNDITFNQLNLAQKNAQAGINSGLDGEAILVRYASNMAFRALNAAKATIGVAFEVFSATVIGLNAQIRASKAQMEGAVQIEQSQIEVYEASLEAKREEITALAQNVTAMIQAYKSLLSAYRSEIGANRAQANVDISWRKANFRQNVANIRSKIETDILGVQTGLSAIGINTEVLSSKALYLINYLSAALSSLQLMIREDYTLQNTESA